MSPLLLGFDIGGTFTDIVLSDPDSELHFYHKVPSTPGAPADAAIEGIQAVLRSAGRAAKDVTSLRHGTTVATNAVLEGRYASTALVTTRGFRDVLELARQVRPHLYDLDRPKPDPIAPRNLRFELTGRMSANGGELTPVDREELAGLVSRLSSDSGIEAVAVCFLHAYANGEHERMVVDTLRNQVPHLPVCASTEVANEFREYERFCSTVVNASLLPIISDYIKRLVSETHEMGLEVGPMIMQSNGGLMPPQTAMKRPISTFLSGPAAGVVGAVATAAIDRADSVITFDMGGTSTDVCLVRGGKPTVRREQHVAGLPVRTPTVDIHTVGAGGGSVAWLDAGGLLKVGPQSAGANPGPACYGLGGMEPTLTDANILLGRLSADSLLGGRMPLDREASARAVASKICRPSGMPELQAAIGILRIATSNVVQAIRKVSVERGHDPREFALVAFGGAGPMHAIEVALELGIGTVVIPSHPGLVCAQGLLGADVAREFSRTGIHDLASTSSDAIAGLYESLGTEFEDWRNEEKLAADVGLVSVADLRYRGQDFELGIPLDTDPRGLTTKSIEALSARFHAEYERTYGYAKPDRPIEFVTGRLMATVPTATGEPISYRPRDGSPVLGDRPVWFDGCGVTSTPVYVRERLEPGWAEVGPAIIEEMDSTSVIPPKASVAVAASGSLIVRVPTASTVMPVAEK